MKKIVWLMVIVVVVLGIFDLRFSKAIINENGIVKKNEQISKTDFKKSFDILIDNENHEVVANASSTDVFSKKISITFDGKQIGEIVLDTYSEFDKLKKYEDINEQDFYFIKGYDNKTYLGIKLGLKFILVNADGEKLVHKPFQNELDYFSLCINYNINNQKLYKLKDKADEDIVKKYFYKDNNFDFNDGFTSLKIENNKILGFITAPSTDEHIISAYEEFDMYLSEFEYVIYNDEIYYKELNKYEIYLDE